MHSSMLRVLLSHGLHQPSPDLSVSHLSTDINHLRGPWKVDLRPILIIILSQFAKVRPSES